MISRAVTEYARAGVAAFHIEDQLFQKRCGHLGGKQVVPIDEYIARVKAAKQAKEKVRSDIAIIGRIPRRKCTLMQSLASSASLRQRS